jgi:hypothetical protein
LGYVLITRLGFGLSAKVCFSRPRVYLPEQGKLLCKISPTESLGCLFLDLLVQVSVPALILTYRIKKLKVF